MNFTITLNEQVKLELEKLWEKEFKKKEINLPFKKTPTSFENHQAMINFINEEFPLWSKILEDSQLSNLTNKINQAVNHSTNPHQATSNIRELFNLLVNLSIQKEIIYSKSPEGKLITKLDTTEAKGFHKYITNKPYSTRNSNLDSKLIYGTFLAILFEKGFVKKNDIQELLKSPEDIFNDYQTDYEEAINVLKKKKNELEEQIGTLQNFILDIEEKTSNDISSLNKEWKKEVSDLVSEKKSYIETLEAQYSEKLKLSGPTQYWNELSKTYKKQGIIWSIISLIIGIGLGFIIWGLSLHLNLSDTTDVTNTLQKYLIVAVATSIGFYLLSQGVKITMSRFHLSTDYEERAQLTNVYLALIKAEENYPTEEKQIILQSIFSRSESGLIKGDSGPVMPNNILSQLLRNTR
ncbi:DUF6161 domain-containing protein [Bacillus alkalicellulosilyticus]|uniref:DUF6161 domain-containing protein n=1 Tax=Alkalihalobacterium alkalicellulosilyticum TaxID=1912214 RepID=UPI00099770D5|nr:DUF6161 domain-containing protein [Bacillus alkalicellulosilyticus]